LTKNGVMEPELLYEPPFTDIHHEGIGGIFDVSQADELISLIRQVNLSVMVG